MASMHFQCVDCGEKFDLQYLFFKPDKTQCPSCGSKNVREEKEQSSQCGCGTRGGNPGRFT